MTGKPLIEVLDDCPEEDLAALLRAIATPCSPEDLRCEVAVQIPDHSLRGGP